MARGVPLSILLPAFYTVMQVTHNVIAENSHTQHVNNLSPVVAHKERTEVHGSLNKRSWPHFEEIDAPAGPKQKPAGQGLQLLKGINHKIPTVLSQKPVSKQSKSEQIKGKPHSVSTLKESVKSVHKSQENNAETVLNGVEKITNEKGARPVDTIADKSINERRKTSKQGSAASSKTLGVSKASDHMPVHVDKAKVMNKMQQDISLGSVGNQHQQKLQDIKSKNRDEAHVMHEQNNPAEAYESEGGKAKVHKQNAEASPDLNHLQQKAQKEHTEVQESMNKRSWPHFEEIDGPAGPKQKPAKQGLQLLKGINRKIPTVLSQKHLSKGIFTHTKQSKSEQIKDQPASVSNQKESVKSVQKSQENNAEIVLNGVEKINKGKATRPVHANADKSINERPKASQQGSAASSKTLGLSKASEHIPVHVDKAKVMNKMQKDTSLGSVGNQNQENLQDKKSKNQDEAHAMHEQNNPAEASQSKGGKANVHKQDSEEIFNLNHPQQKGKSFILNKNKNGQTIHRKGFNQGKFPNKIAKVNTIEQKKSNTGVRKDQGVKGKAATGKISSNAEVQKSMQVPVSTNSKLEQTQISGSSSQNPTNQVVPQKKADDISQHGGSASEPQKLTNTKELPTDNAHKVHHLQERDWPRFKDIPGIGGRMANKKFGIVHNVQPAKLHHSFIVKNKLHKLEKSPAVQALPPTSGAENINQRENPQILQSRMNSGIKQATQDMPNVAEPDSVQAVNSKEVPQESISSIQNQKSLSNELIEQEKGSTSESIAENVNQQENSQLSQTMKNRPKQARPWKVSELDSEQSANSKKVQQKGIQKASIQNQNDFPISNNMIEPKQAWGRSKHGYNGVPKNPKTRLQKRQVGNFWPHLDNIIGIPKKRKPKPNFASSGIKLHNPIRENIKQLHDAKPQAAHVEEQSVDKKSMHNGIKENQEIQENAITHSVGDKENDNEEIHKQNSPVSSNKQRKWESASQISPEYSRDHNNDANNQPNADAKKLHKKHETPREYLKPVAQKKNAQHGFSPEDSTGPMQGDGKAKPESSKTQVNGNNGISKLADKINDESMKNMKVQQVLENKLPQKKTHDDSQVNNIGSNPVNQKDTGLNTVEAKQFKVIINGGKSKADAKARPEKNTKSKVNQDKTSNSEVQMQKTQQMQIAQLSNIDTGVDIGTNEDDDIGEPRDKEEISAETGKHDMDQEIALQEYSNVSGVGPQVLSIILGMLLSMIATLY